MDGEETTPGRSVCSWVTGGTPEWELSVVTWIGSLLTFGGKKLVHHFLLLSCPTMSTWE